MRQTSFIIIFIAAVTSACTDAKSLSEPTLKLSPLSATALANPIAFAVVDEEASERGAEYASKLVRSICSAYPRALRNVAPSAIPSQGNVAFKLTIRRLGSYFVYTKFSDIDKRLKNPDLAMSEHAGWRPVILEASIGQPIVGGFVTYGAGWVGTAHFDVQLNDLRRDPPMSTEFSIAAERAGGNALGYLTAKSTADDAWKIVGPAINRFIIATVNKVDQESPAKGSPNTGQCMPDS